MAKYTISIMDKLLEAAGDQSLQNPVVLLNASKKALFGVELEKIDAKYRDVFASGFALHFFKDEIGLETFPLWRMSLIEKIYNNCDYINQTYDLLDKQCFANYRVHKVVTDSDMSNTTNSKNASSTTSSGEVNNVNNVTKDGKNETVNTESSTGVNHNESSTVNTDHSSVEGNTLLNDIKSLNETDRNTTRGGGTDVVDGVTTGNVKAKTYSKVTGESHNTAFGRINIDGRTENHNTEKRISKNHQESEQDQKYSDTPQNGLSGLKNDSYLTNATIVSSVNDSNTKDNGRKDEYNENHSETKNRSKSDDYSESTTNGTSSSKTRNTDNTTTTKNSKSSYNGTKEIAEQNNQTGLSKTISDGNSNSIVTDNGNSKNDLTGNSKSNISENEKAVFNGNNTNKIDGTSTTDTENNGNTHTEVSDIYYDMNYEMLINAETLLNRVWRIFDDLFFQLL